MRPPHLLVFFTFLSACAARSQEVAKPVWKPAVAATATASTAPPSLEIDEAVSEEEQRVEPEPAEKQKYSPNPFPPEAYAACQEPVASPLLAACKAGQRTGSCGECPSYTAFSGPGTGMVVPLLRGSFSGPYEEALLVVGGCEPHSNNYGGLLLTRKVDGGWTKVVYLPGAVPRRCEAGAKIDGASRVLCLEGHGLNSGTYETMATLIDFRSRRVDHLFYAMCEDGIDVERVRWGGVDKREVRVNVAYGVQRDNDGQGCVDVRGAQRRTELVYVEASGEYAPTPATETQLRKLKPRDPDHALDPVVAAATGASERTARELLPERAARSFNELLCLEP